MKTSKISYKNVFKGTLLASGLVMATMALAQGTPYEYKVEGNKVDKLTWVGSKIYERAFGRGCGTCHDVRPNPDLLQSVQKLSRDEFAEVLKNGRGGMPKADDAIMQISLVEKAGITKEQAIDAIYTYLKGRANGDIPAGSLRKLK